MSFDKDVKSQLLIYVDLFSNMGYFNVYYSESQFDVVDPMLTNEERNMLRIKCRPGNVRGSVRIWDDFPSC